MELPFDLVRTFDAVLRTGSLDAAAVELQLTPSAVSQRIKTLETRLGRVLLVRSRPVRATEAGQVVARLARQLTGIEHDALAELGLAGPDATTVPLAVNADSLATWFLPALAPLAAQGIVFDLYRDDQDFTAGLLESGTVTAAVTSQDRPVAGCSVRPLGSMRYLPVASPTFAGRWFAGGGTPDAAPLVDFDRRDTIQSRFLESLDLDPAAPPRHRGPPSADFATAVELGFGWALVPEFQANDRLNDGRFVQIMGDPVDVALFWQRWKFRSSLLESIESAVIDTARATLRQ